MSEPVDTDEALPGGAVSDQPPDPDGLAKLLAFRYAVPYADHWEQMTPAQQEYWRGEATTVRAYLKRAEGVQC